MKLNQDQIPEIEKVKETDPMTYEALRKVQLILTQHATVINQAVGDGDIVTKPPEGYQALGVTYFSNADHINSVPPPPVDADPVVPPPPNPQAPIPRMPVVKRAFTNRSVGVRNFR